MRYDASGFDVQKVLTSVEMKRIVTEQAVKVVNSASARAPVKTGAYRRSIHAEYDDHGGIRSDRFVATIVAGNDPGSDHAAAVEWGNSGGRGNHVLKGALESLE